MEVLWVSSFSHTKTVFESVIPPAPGDFSSTTVQLAFTSGNVGGPLCFNVLIQDDDICEDDEFFTARVISADTNVQIVRQSINVQILDNDGECNSE